MGVAFDVPLETTPPTLGRGEGSSSSHRRLNAVGTARLLALVATLWCAAFLFGATTAHALKAIDIGNDSERTDITQLGEPMEGRGDSLQIETAPGADGVSGRMSVRASTPGTSPNWFVFALRNMTDKPQERWIVAERYALVGSGIIWPELDGRRIDSVTPSLGFVPERLPFENADAFRLTIEPGQTITFAAELAGDRLPRMQLWKGLDYEKRSRNRQLFQGILLGVTGLLAVFLTTVFAANHKAIFPTAALFTWCVLAYLCVDFGFWHKVFNVRPEENAQYRAAGEAAMVATLLVFLYTFLRLGRWHGFIRMLLGLWMAAQFLLVGLAFLDPRLAATFARLSIVAVTGVGALLTLFLALRMQDRALSIVPVWVAMAVWLFASAMLFTGRLGGDFIVNGWTAGLVLIVVLIGFIVTQYAFRSIEPLYGVAPDDQRLRSLAIDGTGAALFDWNARRDEIKVGPSIEAALGREPHERIEPSQRFADAMHPADRERFKQLLVGLKERGSGELRFEFRMRHTDNSYRWFELEANAPHAGDRRLTRCVGLIRETTDLKRAQDRLLHDAVHDSLTNLPNRALLLDRLAMAVSRARIEPLVKPTVVFIDLDRFKSINSSFGLVIGDSLLITVARRLQRLLGPSDTLGRIGGDQFAMIYPASRDEREQMHLAEDIRTALKAPINIGNQEIVLTASIGIAWFDGKGEQTEHDVLSDAETAMHRAKATGSDHIAMFSAPMRADKDSRVALESELRFAIEKKQLTVLFQPIMYLRTEELAGFEALVRWEHPRLGDMNPADFVPLAEESDLIVKLGAYVLQAAVAEAQRWHKELPRPDNPLFVSVNVSTRQLFRPDLVSEVRQIMGRGLLPKGSLRLEITESLVMENPEQATKVLENLAATGAVLALDDFGAGYSSLCYLNLFPFSTIKIDRALVHMSSQTGSSTAILRSVVALAHELGKSVVAEGVEVEEDVGLLRSIGCEFAQGFFYGKPASAREVMQILKAERKQERRLKRSGLFRLKSRRVDEDAVPTAKRPPKPAAKVANGIAGGAEAVQGKSALAQARMRPPPVPPTPTSTKPNGAHPPVQPTPVPPTVRTVPPTMPLGAKVTGTVPPLRPATPPPGAPPLPQAAPRPAAQAPSTAPVAPRSDPTMDANRSLARLQAELQRPTSRPTAPAEAVPPTVPLTQHPVDAKPSQTQPTQPRPAPPAAPAQPVAKPETPTNRTSTLPPAIAASLARLAGKNAPAPGPDD